MVVVVPLRKQQMTWAIAQFGGQYQASHEIKYLYFTFYNWLKLQRFIFQLLTAEHQLMTDV